MFEIKGLSRNDVVTIKSAVGTIKAVVCLAEGDQCGLKFVLPIGQRQMEQIRHAPTTLGPIRRPVHAFTEMR